MQLFLNNWLLLLLFLEFVRILGRNRKDSQLELWKFWTSFRVGKRQWGRDSGEETVGCGQETVGNLGLAMVRSHYHKACRGKQVKHSVTIYGRHAGTQSHTLERGRGNISISNWPNLTRNQRARSQRTVAHGNQHPGLQPGQKMSQNGVEAFILRHIVLFYESNL